MGTDSNNRSVHQMKNTHRIAIQLVHIGGPLKGVIQELTDHDIYIGRHSSCQVKFPDELFIVSRKHARIKREDNRFQLVDESTNGTFVNGKRVRKAYLRNGDILTFAKDGPKVSFLTKISEGQPTGMESSALERTVQQTGSPDPYDMVSPQGRPLSLNNSPQTPSHIESNDKLNLRPKKDPAIQKEKVTLIIQHGPTLQSFNDLPIVIGRNVKCNFIIDQSSIRDQHAQIFFYENKFWIKDLTGKQCLRINGNPVIDQRALVIEDILTLSDQGPSFRFLGGGRLSEVKQAANVIQKDSTSSTNTDPGRMKKKKKSKFPFKIW
jgi:pSer/pThr/pTyr-binding forkhead associated (FHA) protein